MSRKLLLVINTMGMGGAERAMIALMNAMPSDCEISLLPLINRGELFSEVPERVRILGGAPDAGSVLDKGGTRKLKRVSARALFKRAGAVRRAGYIAKNLISQIREKRLQPDKIMWRLISDAAPRFDKEYDMAIAYLEGGATYYVADHVRARKKASFVHIDYLRAGYSRLTDLDSYDKIDRIYAVSKETGEHFTQVHPEQKSKIKIFHNLIDTARIASLAGEKGFDDGYGGVRLLTVGRLHPQKAYDMAIPAFKKVLDSGVDARWYVLGEGQEREALEKLIAENGLEGKFVLLGARSNPYPFIREADLYVHATRFEGKSIAIEEALFLGKCVLATDCSGTREQITDGVNGKLIDLSVDNLANALIDILNAPETMRKYAEAASLHDIGGLADVNDMMKWLEE